MATFYIRYGDDGEIIDQIEADNWADAAAQRPTPLWVRPGLRLKMHRSLPEGELTAWEAIYAESQVCGNAVCPNRPAERAA